MYLLMFFVYGQIEVLQTSSCSSLSLSLSLHPLFLSFGLYVYIYDSYEKYFPQIHRQLVLIFEHEKEQRKQ